MWCGAWLLGAAAPASFAAAALPDRGPFPGVAAPAEAAEAMPLADVRVGMRGYGLTVFAGTKIEPFPVVVRSVVGDSNAGRATVWVECTDERMQRSGPVQGMSGSPIYLWDEAEAADAEPGVGGRLIGAFAFGYANVNVCLVGVQPIAYMREVGENAVRDERAAADAPDGEGGAAPRAVRPAADVLAGLPEAAARAGLPAVQTRKLSRLRRVDFGHGGGAGVSAGGGALAEAADGPRALRLPLQLSRPEAARWLDPAFAAVGLATRAGGAGAGAGAGRTPGDRTPGDRAAGGPEAGRIAAAPPSNVDESDVELAPGSVLSIPLAWGDLDLNAAGTVTEVRPDGTVLAFGHAMEAVGSTRLPMASGYTHFVVSRTSISFKQAGSLRLVGSILRDEAAAVAGRPFPAGAGGDGPGREQADPGPAVFASAPVSVRVEHAGQPARDYAYRMVDDPAMTGGLLAALLIESAVAVQDFPIEHTLHLSGTVRFSDGRTLELSEPLPGGGLRGLVFATLPFVNPLTQNPFTDLRVTGAELTLRIDDTLELATLESATLDRAAVRPGETVRAEVTLRSYRGRRSTRTLALTVPADLPDGEYELVVSDVGGHLDRVFGARPDLLRPADLDALFASVQTVAGADGQTLYAGLVRPEPGLALGGRPLAPLPGSRAAIFGGASTSRVLPFARYVETSAALDEPVTGLLELPLTVRRTLDGED